MAKFNTLRNLITEDFPDKYQDLTTKLVFALNPFIQQVFLALNNGLTIEDNMAGQRTEVTLTAPISSTSPLFVKNTMKGQCQDIIVSRVQNITQPTVTLAAAPFVDFTNSDADQIKITNITGLVSGNKYKIRLICFR